MPYANLRVWKGKEKPHGIRGTWLKKGVARSKHSQFIINKCPFCKGNNKCHVSINPNSTDKNDEIIRSDVYDWDSNLDAFIYMCKFIIFLSFRNVRVFFNEINVHFNKWPNT